ncbi:hypothetical protein QBC41DRAFT_108063 [Cercophora samala]|uniref:Uncharacterized protein n=1 Tax=Cercophora samala TaxID=330535 RepID=A0AA39ZEV5_9PEZI|nr:hypothetical protein QBC41DRAFT_108063 [Cercophora samala]
MDGRPPMENSDQAKSTGGDHRGVSDAGGSSDEPEKPDAELLALMRDSERYLRLTEPQDGGNNKIISTGAESRSPPPLPPPPEPTPASTAAPTPSGTPGTVGLFPRTRPNPLAPPGRLLTQKEIDEYWATAPARVADPPTSPTAPPDDNNTPITPNPTTPPGSGGISIPITLPFRPTPEKLDAVEKQPAQQSKLDSPTRQPKHEVFTPASHKRNKSHGDHIDSAIRTRLPDSASPKPRPKLEGISVPTPTRPPPPPPVKSPPGSTIDTEATPTRVASPNFKRLMGREPSSDRSSWTVPGPSTIAGSPPVTGAGQGRGKTGILVKDPSGNFLEIRSLNKGGQDAVEADRTQTAARLEKMWMEVKGFRSIQIDDIMEGREKGGEEDEKGNLVDSDEAEDKRKDEGDGKDDEKKLEAPSKEKEKDSGDAS